jgi:hypothetical protein
MRRRKRVGRSREPRHQVPQKVGGSTSSPSFPRYRRPSRSRELVSRISRQDRGGDSRRILSIRPSQDYCDRHAVHSVMSAVSVPLPRSVTAVTSIPTRRRRPPWGKIGAITVVVAVLVTAAVLSFLISGTTRIAVPIPLSQVFALDPVSLASVDGIVGIPCTGPAPSQCYAYIFQITLASGGVAWNSIFAIVVTRGTHSLLPLPQGNASQTGIAGYAVCPGAGSQPSAAADVIYAVGNNWPNWTRGTGSGSTEVSTTQTLVVYVAASTTNPDPLEGDLLALRGAGAYSGLLLSSVA